MLIYKIINHVCSSGEKPICLFPKLIEKLMAKEMILRIYNHPI